VIEAIGGHLPSEGKIFEGWGSEGLGISNIPEERKGKGTFSKILLEVSRILA